MNLMLFLVLSAACALFMVALERRWNERNAPRPKARAAHASESAAPSASRIQAHVPELQPLKWGEAVSPADSTADGAPSTSRQAESRTRAPGSASHSFGGNETERKIRTRYISVRFPGVGANGLADSDRVIKAARLFFEEEQPDKALELLDLAIEERPAEEALRLAQIEIAFLERDAPRYCALARELRRALPDAASWHEVARLGRLVAPREPLFGPVESERVHEHYGPWPDMPNWIQAPWDLTAEVHGADFHRAMAATREPGRVHPPKAA